MSIGVGALAQERDRLIKLKHDTRSYTSEVRTQPLAHPGILGALVVGVGAALWDGIGTWLALRTGFAEERNVAAAAGMGLVGMEVYIVLATLVSLILTSLVLVRCRGTILGAIVPLFALVFIFFKVWTVLGNAFQWTGFAPW